MVPLMLTVANPPSQLAIAVEPEHFNDSLWLRYPCNGYIEPGSVEKIRLRQSSCAAQGTVLIIILRVHSGHYTKNIPVAVIRHFVLLFTFSSCLSCF